MRFAEKAIELDPELASAWNNKGIALNGQGKYDEALKALDEAIRINPEYPVYWDNKGRLLRYLHRDAEADAAFAKAKELGA